MYQKSLNVTSLAPVSAEMGRKQREQQFRVPDQLQTAGWGVIQLPAPCSSDELLGMQVLEVAQNQMYITHFMSFYHIIKSHAPIQHRISPEIRLILRGLAKYILVGTERQNSCQYEENNFGLKMTIVL